MLAALEKTGNPDLVFSSFVSGLPQGQIESLRKAIND
jgi:hypothetical protein